MIAAETYIDIMTSPAHVLAELSIEFITGIFVYPVGRHLFRRFLKNHDQEVHHADQ